MSTDSRCASDVYHPAVPGQAADDWITPPRAAELLGLQLHTVHRLIERVDLVAEVVPPGRRNTGRRRDFRIRREALDDFIKRARVKPGELRHLYPS